MLHVSTDSSRDRESNGYLRKARSPLSLLSALSALFRRRRMDEAADAVPRVPSSLSVSAVDVVVVPSGSGSVHDAACAGSTLTLTPGRTRDLDQDMAALRLSRQDNPFLQELQQELRASSDSLVDSMDEAEADDTNLMAGQEFPTDIDIDPLTLPEIHQHMIRSPPPVTWPKSPNFKVFRFPLQSSDEDSSQESLNQCGKKKVSPHRPDLECLRQLSAEALSTGGPGGGVSPRQHSRSCKDFRERSPLPFSLLPPDVRRLHCRSSDDSVQLVSSTDGADQHRMDLTMMMTMTGGKRPA